MTGDTYNSSTKLIFNDPYGGCGEEFLDDGEKSNKLACIPIAERTDLVDSACEEH